MNQLPPFSALMSPPDKNIDSFHSNHPAANTPISSAQSSFNSQQQQLPSIADVCGPVPDFKMAVQPKSPPPRVPLSPPISPWVGNNKNQGDGIGEEQVAAPMRSSTATQLPQDPVLYPQSEAGSEVATVPLFEQSQESSRQPQAEEKAIEGYINMHMAQFTDRSNKPTLPEYKLAVHCIPKIGFLYNLNPGAYAMKERKIVEEQFRHAKRMRVLAPASSTTGLIPSKVVKRAPRTPRTPKAPSKRTPRTAVYNSFDAPQLTSPKTPRIEKIEDSDFASIPDYCPPIDSANNIKALKTDWKGQSTNLSGDPHRDLLHPAEVAMAATLRLTCAQYLTTKRRIFKSKLEYLKAGNPNFKKTHAQKACSIDVNKASKLWMAFEKVGWFETEHFIKWL